MATEFADSSAAERSFDRQMEAALRGRERDAATEQAAAARQDVIDQAAATKRPY
jgi:hypothetical protein